METRKGIHISGNYIVHHKLYAFFIAVLSILKKCRAGQNRITYIYIFQLNDRPKRCFNFGLCRIRSNGCKFEMHLK